MFGLYKIYIHYGLSTLIMFGLYKTYIHYRLNILIRSTFNLMADKIVYMNVNCSIICKFNNIFQEDM